MDVQIYRASDADKQHTQILVATFGDAERLRLATGRTLLRHQPSHAENSLPFRKAETFPIAATIAVAAIVPGTV
jgi:hypothetical protein